MSGFGRLPGCLRPLRNVRDIMICNVRVQWGKADSDDLMKSLIFFGPIAAYVTWTLQRSMNEQINLREVQYELYSAQSL